MRPSTRAALAHDLAAARARGFATVRICQTGRDGDRLHVAWHHDCRDRGAPIVLAIRHGLTGRVRLTMPEGAELTTAEQSNLLACLCGEAILGHVLCWRSGFEIRLRDVNRAEGVAARVAAVLRRRVAAGPALVPPPVPPCIGLAFSVFGSTAPGGAA
jgi:hypothetical protein